DEVPRSAADLARDQVGPRSGERLGAGWIDAERGGVVRERLGAHGREPAGRASDPAAVQAARDRRVLAEGASERRRTGTIGADDEDRLRRPVADGGRRW